ncbi:hypothetical protein SELMODRAFT_270723 [Selaginella moellendorffii]|uniref:Chromo domain-containing protein n=1 Tax=Selaginella moellendorffii TaxID=88036 RepID=D8RDK6_SELML|nr:signal recognition particle 43 kDa protein, chloroplastic [Selaginella moellendorffii]EFJ30043.1 hypothetical protein SELMODRAFT_270723 [Selaginella moellendorffii]|eukprot:XP_024529330.1 signal recognition particle 43 kDa protein, chloroplastic [Selaginella moellendorffii]
MAGVSLGLSAATLRAALPGIGTAQLAVPSRFSLPRLPRTRLRCVQEKPAVQAEEALAIGKDNGSLAAPHENFGEVNRILGSRVVNREMQYLIEWKDDHPDTWEPAENIAGDVLSEYVTPWWQGAKKADESKLMELLEDEGRDVDAIDDNKRTALLFAAGLGSESCVRSLIEAGADIDWQDQDGYTALHIAAGYVHSNVVKALLELGADPDVEDSKGRSSLKLAQDLLNRTPKANPLQFARRLALDQVVRLLDEACYETVSVDQVLDKRMAAGNKVEYLVKWSDETPDSWLPASEISDDLIKDYEAGLEYGIVERILDKRVQGESIEYLVKWADSDKDSWEPSDNVAPELVQEYEVNQRAND